MVRDGERNLHAVTSSHTPSVVCLPCGVWHPVIRKASVRPKFPIDLTTLRTVVKTPIVRVALLQQHQLYKLTSYLLLAER